MSECPPSRITFKRTRPNPLFQDWLEELHTEAKAKKSKLESMLNEALESLSKYPLPLQTGAECAILIGFDKRLCAFLDKRLEVYKSQTDISLSSEENSEDSDATIIDDNIELCSLPEVEPQQIGNEKQQESCTSSSQSSVQSNNLVNDISKNNKKKSFQSRKQQESCMSSSQSSVQSNNLVNDISKNNKKKSLQSRKQQESCTSSSQSSVQSNNLVNDISKNNKKKSLQSRKQQESCMSSSQSSVQSNNLANNVSENNKKSPKSRKNYKPAFRSGSYAILVALLEQHKICPESSLTKEQLIEKAQDYSEESFTRPKPESFYTAWSNMTRLVSKGLVEKRRSKKVYFKLSDQGVIFASELVEEYESQPTANDVIFNDALAQPIATISAQDAEELDSQDVAKTPKVVIELEPGSFEVILLIDKQETGGVKKSDPTVAQFNKYPDLKHEYRSLKVGDFTWIARHRLNKDQELVLPYVVERKRMDDLGHSIKDGRFHEQKFRLRKCGLKNVTYLVENYGGNKFVGLPIQSLMQALANTRVHDRFKVHMTSSLTESARFLAIMTKRLTIEFKDKYLSGANKDPEGDNLMTFNYFSKSSSKTKTLTVTETFIKLLLQLKGLSVEKALAITQVYSTPRSLIEAYEECSQKEAEFLLANLKYGGSRNVGSVASKTIYQLFYNKDLI